MMTTKKQCWFCNEFKLQEEFFPESVGTNDICRKCDKEIHPNNLDYLLKRKKQLVMFKSYNFKKIVWRLFSNHKDNSIPIIQRKLKDKNIDISKHMINKIINEKLKK